MRPVDATMDVLSDIAENHGQIPDTWVRGFEDYVDNGMNLAIADIAIVNEVLKRSSPCKFLEIGAGVSTKRLFAVNPNGLNITLEDNPEWSEKVCAELPAGQGIVLRYENKVVQSKDALPHRGDWRAKIQQAFGVPMDQLRIEDMRLLQKRLLIPDWLWTINFDVILVDGPYGAEWGAPGRSGTLHLASRLATPTSVIFVDDANRENEMQQTLRFMGDRYLHWTPSKKMVIAV